MLFPGFVVSISDESITGGKSPMLTGTDDRISGTDRSDEQTKKERSMKKEATIAGYA